jgi:ATP/maltotriose-dependent transcriptional regulator MalT
MLADADQPCASRGLSLVVDELVALAAGDLDTAAAVADEVLAVGRRFADEDVVALGLLCTGEVAIARGDVDPGLRLLDEAMVALAADDLSPITAGIVYCAVIEACMRALDLARAAEWTEAFRRWCASQPDLVPFRGQCLVHRSQVLQARGDWAQAVVESDQACRILGDPVHPVLALATYQRGELHRVRGDLDAAEQAYLTAATLGFDPDPGMPLLRLAQGRVPEAVAGAAAMVERLPVDPSAAAGLAAAVEVFVAAGDLARARSANDRLVGMAADHDGVVAVLAALASGTVALAEGRDADGLAAFREARGRARELDLPYEGARAGIGVAEACRALGDRSTADAEIDAAIATFDRLGARGEAGRARALRHPADRPGRLTDREVEVLRLVATGDTNREIASSLRISEHTVARHVQNIFTKLGETSRAAATSSAYEHGLLRPGDRRRPS